MSDYDQYAEFDKYYKEIFGKTWFIYHKPKGDAREKSIIRSYMAQAERRSDRNLASQMLDMAYEIKNRCGDEEFHLEIAKRYDKVL